MDSSGKMSWIFFSKSVINGATPEEILVPVIIAHKGRRLAQSHRAEAINLKVSGLQKTVEIKIIPVSEDLSVKLSAADGTSTTMSYNRNTKTWTGELKTGIEQEIRVTVEAESFVFRTVPPTRMGGKYARSKIRFYNHAGKDLNRLSID